MKHFVYLDTDLINSYLAQLNDGLITASQEEVEASVTEEATEENRPDRSVSDIELGIPSFLNYNKQLNEGYLTEINTISQTNAGKEVLSKMIHDNSYENLKKYLNKEKGVIDYDGSVDLNLNDYISIEGNLKMVDLSALMELVGEEFSNVYKLITTKELDKNFNSLNREARRSSKIKKSIENSKKEIDDELKEISNIKMMINYIMKLLPSDKYIIYENIFIPLDDKYLRENHNSLRYKYSSNSTIVGHVTGSIKDIIDFKSNNIFGDLLETIDEMFLVVLGMLSIEEDFKVMHPISWYY